MKRRTPDEVLDDLVRRLHEPDEPDAGLCGRIGAGGLEELLRHCEEELWPRIVQLATDDIRFRRALSGVWAYSSPAYWRRTELLASLGEHWPERIEFIASRHDFGDDAKPSWRAFERDGRVSDLELADLLESVANWLRRTENHTQVHEVRRTEDERRGPWRELGNRLGLGWSGTPDENGVYVGKVGEVDRDVELVQVHLRGWGNVDVEPLAGHVVVVHWDVPEDFTPPSPEVVAVRRAGEWTPAR
jgi:hypothetical protein